MPGAAGGGWGGGREPVLTGVGGSGFGCRLHGKGGQAADSSNERPPPSAHILLEQSSHPVELFQFLHLSIGANFVHPIPCPFDLLTPELTAPLQVRYH